MKPLKQQNYLKKMESMQMKGLSPLDKLSQGYSYVSDASGRTLSTIEQVELGDAVTIYIKDGQLDAQITKKRKESWEN